MSLGNLVKRALELAEAAVVAEGLDPPHVTVVLVDKIEKARLPVVDGVDVNEEADVVVVEKSTLDNILFRLLAGVFYLSMWNMFHVKAPEKARELARKHFFKCFVLLLGSNA